jgi:adenosine deaminase
MLARLAALHAGQGPGQVVGFGLSNDERRGSTTEFAPAFDIARRAGLACVPHGGELLGAGAVKETLTSLAPDRLGHGVRSAEDPRVLAEVVRRGVTLEICPGSNVALGVYKAAEAVPLRQLMAAGARIALGADDPLLFGSRLNAQYETARRVHALTDVELAGLAQSSVRGSRAPQAVKEQILTDIDGWLAG